MCPGPKYSAFSLVMQATHLGSLLKIREAENSSEPRFGAHFLSYLSVLPGVSRVRVCVWRLGLFL